MDGRPAVFNLGHLFKLLFPLRHKCVPTFPMEQIPFIVFTKLPKRFLTQYLFHNTYIFNLVYTALSVFRVPYNIHHFPTSFIYLFILPRIAVLYGCSFVFIIQLTNYIELWVLAYLISDNKWKGLTTY